MTRTNRGRMFFAHLAVFIAVTCPWSHSHAQQGSGLPAGWQGLPPNELAQAMAGAYDPDLDVFSGNVDEAAVRANAASVYSAIDLENTAESYQTLFTLYAAGLPNLEDAVKEKTSAFLAARQDNWAGKPYGEVHAKIYFMHRVRLRGQQKLLQIRQWVQAGGQMADIAVPDLTHMRHALGATHLVEGNFTMRWSGQLTAPESGAYTFSISPVNVNAAYYTRHDRYDVKTAMTVSIGGEAILSATPAQWVSDSAPVNLTAGEPVALQVDYSAESPDSLPRVGLHALLYWQGPGVAKSIVPKERLTPAGGAGQGLQMTVNWQADGQPQSFTQVVPAIDAVWGADGVVFFEDLAVQQQVNDRLWTLLAPAYLDESVQTGKRHHFLEWSRETVESVTAAQRNAIMDAVLQRPSMVDSLQPKEMVDIYRCFRLGAPEKALDVFGLWAMRHADLESQLPHEYEPKMVHFKEFFGFDFYYRRAFRYMAVCVTQQLPAHAARLQSEFLELDDGRCCLPVAYTLAYSYLGQGRLQEWIDLLVAKLNDQSLTGDKRVNWLLARAFAEEMRLGAPNPYSGVEIRPMDGRVWIDEANLVAESLAVKTRLAKELAGRLSAIRKFDDAKSVLQTASDAAPPELLPKLTEWRATVDRFEAAHTKSQEDQPIAAQKAYVAKLRERRERASAAGNTEAASRYDALIDAAESE